MGRNKPPGRKARLISRGKKRSAPRWVDIKKFGLKRARTRRVRIRTKQWRRDKLKV
jgi:ribosomal protein L39E